MEAVDPTAVQRKARQEVLSDTWIRNQPTVKLLMPELPLKSHPRVVGQIVLGCPEFWGEAFHWGREFFKKHLSGMNLKLKDSRSPMNLKYNKSKKHLKICH